MQKDIFDRFLDLANQLSPENLCCDGLASQSYINQKLKKNKEWKALEKKAGKKVTEDDIWAIYLKENK